MELGFKTKGAGRNLCKFNCFGLEEQEQTTEYQKAKWKDNCKIFNLE